LKLCYPGGSETEGESRLLFAALDLHGSAALVELEAAREQGGGGVRLAGARRAVYGRRLMPEVPPWSGQPRPSRRLSGVPTSLPVAGQPKFAMMSVDEQVLGCSRTKENRDSDDEQPKPDYDGECGD